MFDTSILFLIFNRPDTTSLVFEQIKKIQPKYLFVAADGPRDNRPGEDDLCKTSRDIVLKGIDWDCEMKTLFRDENLGCKKAVSGAINWFFENVEQGIILEDDCLPDQSFFLYCEQLLEKYKDDEQIISIGGTNLGYLLKNKDSYAFSRFMNMWGWATWKRAARLVDYDMKSWKQKQFKTLFLQKRIQSHYFSLDINWINYWKNHFNLTSTGKINTWDYQWIFTQLYHNKISIFPSHNLIKNIGFTEQATHTVYPDHPIAQLSLQSIQFPIIHPQKRDLERDYEEDYLKKVWFGHQREPIFKILKTRLLYLPIVEKSNRFIKKNYKK